MRRTFTTLTAIIFFISHGALSRDEVTVLPIKPQDDEKLSSDFQRSKEVHEETPSPSYTSGNKNESVSVEIKTESKNLTMKTQQVPSSNNLEANTTVLLSSSEKSTVPLNNVNEIDIREFVGDVYVTTECSLNTSSTNKLQKIPSNSSTSTMEAQNTKSTLYIFPDSTNCGNYYEICVKEGEFHNISRLNRDFVKTCPRGSFFDGIDFKCLDESEAHCGIYNCSKPDGFFPDPKNDERFIHCYNGNPRRKLCEPRGTVFNKEMQMCVRVETDLPTSLKLLKAFVWLVNATGSEKSELEDGYIKSTADYVITALIAILIPLMYLACIAMVIKEFGGDFHEDGFGPFITDCDDFYRYSTPNPAGRIHSRSTSATIVPESRPFATVGHCATTRM